MVSVLHPACLTSCMGAGYEINLPNEILSNAQCAVQLCLELINEWRGSRGDGVYIFHSTVPTCECQAG